MKTMLYPLRYELICLKIRNRANPVIEMDNLRDLERKAFILYIFFIEKSHFYERTAGINIC